MAKQYPSRVLENAIRAKGFSTQLLWETKGPRGTEVAFLQALAINGHVVIVQTYKGDGWEVYSASPANTMAGALRDVLERTGLQKAIRPIGELIEEHEAETISQPLA